MSVYEFSLKRKLAKRRYDAKAQLRRAQARLAAKPTPLNQKRVERAQEKVYAANRATTYFVWGCGDLEQQLVEEQLTS